jgi:ABC-type ATPase involved in cell division
MSEEQLTAQPGATISQLEFSDGTRIQVGQHDVILVVGPNNAGKSATLRAIRDKLGEAAAESPVLKSIQLNKRGTTEEFSGWIESWTKRRPENPQNPAFMASGHAVHRSQITASWQRSDNSLGQVARWLCHFLSADERLGICNPPGHVSLTQDGPSHPIHYLQRDDALELSISSKFKKAFGVDLIVHRNAGSNVPLHVGERPIPIQGEDRVSLGYIERLEKLPQLQTQGDGMRSFAGVLLATSVGRETVLLIDEPEAFLHPPQAKLLGTSLVEGRGKERQIFIATHSSDIIRGVLDANSPDVKVVRIRRTGNANTVHLLENARVRELWSDPLLRYSNILDGLFHEGVVVCEADSDCRFYSAMLEAAHTSAYPDAKRPDLMFTHCGGKARLPLVIRSLREVDVPVRAVADFDVLSAEQPLKAIVEALGETWAHFEQDWRIVKSAVDAKRPDLNTADVKRELDRVLGTVTSTVLPEKSREELQSLIRRSTAWSNAKLVGKSFVPSGDAARACESLLTSLREAGLHVVEVGELEGFARTEAGHGPKWVNAVLARNLSVDHELEAARQFALKLVS